MVINDDVVSYSDFFQTVKKNRIILLMIFIISALISTIIFLFFPVTYSISGIYKTPSRGFFDQTGLWVEQPYERIETTVLKSQKFNYGHVKECDYQWLQGAKSAPVIKISDQIFEINVMNVDIDCAKSNFESVLSGVRADLHLREAEALKKQNSLLSNTGKYNTKIIQLDFIRGTSIPFSEISPARILTIENNWKSIYKWGLIAALLTSFFYLLLSLIKKPLSTD